MSVPVSGNYRYLQLFNLYMISGTEQACGGMTGAQKTLSSLTASKATLPTHHRQIQVIPAARLLRSVWS